MAFRWTAILALLPHLLFADGPAIAAHSQGEPSANICNAVNILSGDFYINEDDIVVPGLEPIRLHRSYSSSTGRDYLFPHTLVKHYPQNNSFVVTEFNGAKLTYSKKRDSQDIFVADDNCFDKGFTNSATGEIGAKSNLKNQYLEWQGNNIVVVCPDGTKRIYKQIWDQQGYKEFLLTREQKPNGNQILYIFNEKHILQEVKTVNPSETVTYAWIKLKYERLKITIETSDGKVIDYLYRYGPRYRGLPGHLEEVIISSNGEKIFKENLTYCTEEQEKPAALHTRNSSSGNKLEVGYYKVGHNVVAGKAVGIGDRDFRPGRVRELRAPIGPNGYFQPVYSFLYDGKSNGKRRKRERYEFQKSGYVEDALGHTTHFDYSEEYRPLSIEHKDAKGALIYEESLEWTSAKNKAKSELKSRTYFGNGNQKLLDKQFFYDANCNVTTERLIGNFTGKGEETYDTHYKYNPQNQLIEKKEPNGLVTRYTYLRGDLVTSTLVSYQDKIVKRQFNTYNRDNILVETKEDDGSSALPDDYQDVTSCHVTKIVPVKSGNGVGFPEQVQEGYIDLATGAFVQLKRRTFVYNRSCLVEEETHYDADDHKLYTLERKYDAADRLICQTDPRGASVHYRYDFAGNKIYEKLPSGLEKTYTYDQMRRLVSETEKDTDGNKLTRSYQYNVLSQKIYMRDLDGTESHYTYDAMGNCISITCCGRTIQKRYNWQGKVIEEIDGNGNSTKKSYNSRGKVTQITHPDGAIELFRYDLQGNLVEYTDKNGTKTLCEYDPLGRVISQDVAGNKTTHTYQGALLVSSTDPMGNTRTFTYDHAGRKVSESFDGQVIYHEYDTLLRPYKVKMGNRVDVKEYDLCNRVVEERTEDNKGKVLHYTRYKYDLAGNKIAVKKPADLPTGLFNDTTRYTYDAWGRLTSKKNAIGKVSTISYDAKKRLRIKTDAAGYCEHEQLDPFSKLEQRYVYTPEGQRIADESFNYDKNSNLIKQITTVYRPDGTSYLVTTNLEYDKCNRLVKRIEAGSRETRYTYTKSGKRASTIKPDGVILNSKYDALDREISLTSSDGTVHYEYQYDKLSRPTCVEDYITGKKTYRSYDARGNIIKEQLSNGLTVERAYDTEGRIASLTLPDNSSVRYLHGALYLEKVIRVDAAGKIAYEHSYNEYSQKGKLLQQTAIGKIGVMRYTYDALGRPKTLVSPWIDQELKAFDDRNNLTEQRLNKEHLSYSYDHYSQLVAEKNHSYLYDSRNNRLHKDGSTYAVDILDQLTDSEQEQFSYDPNGNRVAGRITKLHYDALDRLIGYQTAFFTVYYTYDPWHRRLTQTVGQHTPHYLYDGLNEIGAYSGDSQQLRILGQGLGAEIGAAVAIEINKKVYLPQHDLFGNVKSLVDVKSKKIVESYTYTAYGEETLYNEKGKTQNSAINPWRFSSKRRDDITNLIYYGRRYYDPIHGRWITTDPARDGPNPYAFLYNHPLLHVDLYGLYTLYTQTPDPRMMAAIAAAKERLDNYITGSVDPKSLLTTYQYEGVVKKTIQHQSNRPYGVVIYTNGLRNNDDDIKANALYLSEICSGAKVFVVKNPEIERGDDWKKTYNNSPSNTNSSSRALNYLLAKMDKEYGQDTQYCLFLHSNGGKIGYDSLHGLGKSLGDRIHVTTVASQVTIPKSFGQSVINLRGRDPVPWAHSSNYEYLYDRVMGQGNRWDVQYRSPANHPDINPWIDHSFKSSTYTKDLQNRFESFSTRYNVVK